MNNYHAILNRFDKGIKQTLGRLDIYKDNDIIFSCVTLELPDLMNERQISCIPKGFYEVDPYKSPKFGKVYQVKDVEDRSYILVHPGNFFTDILGCILVGEKHTDINNDGLKDVVNSKKTLSKLKKVLNYQPFDLEIV